MALLEPAAVSSRLCKEGPGGLQGGENASLLQVGRWAGEEGARTASQARSPGRG